MCTSRRTHARYNILSYGEMGKNIKKIKKKRNHDWEQKGL